MAIQDLPSCLYPLEKALLEELLARLPPNAGHLLARQCQTINVVQRHAGWREVCCYSMKHGKVYHDPALQFPCKDREMKLATITFCFPNSEKNWTARFYCVKGYFFSIVFDRSPKEVLHCPDPRIVRTEIHCDPMIPISQVTGIRRGEIQPLPTWILALGSPSNVRKPLYPEEREQLLRRLGVRLPTDYVALQECCDGLIVNNCVILGLTDIYEVHLEHGDYYVLAELGGCGVLVADPEDGLLYYFAFDGSTELPLGEQFSQAVSWLSKLPDDS